MDDPEFAVRKIRESLEVHEAAIIDLTANGATEEAVREVKQRRDRYAQCLNMMAGPMTEKKRRRFDAW